MTITLTISDAAILTKPSEATATCSESVLPILEPIRDRSQEHLLVITVDSRLKVIAVHTASIGTASASLVHAREVFRPAILDNAVCVILAHNHPSGDRSPSPADLDVTRRVAEAGRILGIELLDHLIVAAGGSTSLKLSHPHLFNP
jgi:DNA repair protein RadC